MENLAIKIIVMMTVITGSLDAEWVSTKNCYNQVYWSETGAQGYRIAANSKSPALWLTTKESHDKGGYTIARYNEDNRIWEKDFN
jgi:hypothetical protein